MNRALRLPLLAGYYSLPSEFVGKRSATKSVAAALVAFMERKTWKQVDLARAIGFTRPEALRNVLRELQDCGLPLTCEKDPPHVYWRVPKDWYPGGVLFKADHVPELLRQLSRAPRSKGREQLLAIVMGQLPARGKLTASAPIVSRAASENEELYLPTVEDAAARRRPLWMRYMTTSRGGKIGDRYASVHMVDVGPPARFIATCHTSRDLRWFRVENIVRARVDDNETFRECDPKRVEAFRAASLDGFKGTGSPMELSFFVREPESSWVAHNVLEGMRVETLHGGIRICATTSALLPLARFVARLGEAARPEKRELAEAVAVLARGALEQAEAFLREREDRGSSEDLSPLPARVRSDV